MRSWPLKVSWWVAAWFLLTIASGCYQQMSDQPRYDPLEKSDLFQDQMASRPLVPGVVARGRQPQEFEEPSSHFLTGVVDGESADTLPGDLRTRWNTEQILERGQEAYDIYCVHCHDVLGTGRGYVPMRGYPQPPSFHTDRMRSKPIGHVFRVITDGFGRMPAHASQVVPADRWAIASYVRALQLSQHAPLDDLNPNDKRAVESGAAADR
ncbi:MAG: cytochrome c [Planctomycetales bacterium]|nr:cytochrome c [Planctomycetales bacterium]